MKIFCLSEEEHKVRDARALLCLQEFFLSTGHHCNIVPISVRGGLTEDYILEATQSSIKGEGVVFVGRPSKFGSWASTLATTLFPRLHYGFASDDDSDDDYRRVTGPGSFGTRIPSFSKQREKKIRPLSLVDHAFFYFGWYGEYPVAWLAGTSTVGTWGAARFVTQVLKESCVKEEFSQGTLEVVVQDTGDLFHSVNVTSGKVLSPCRIWMSGSDLPPPNGWKGISPKRKCNDLNLFVNAKQVRPSTGTYTPTLCLAGWLNNQVAVTHKHGVYVQCTSSKVLAWIRRVTNVEGTRALKVADVSSELARLSDAILDAGGIVWSEPSKPDGRSGQPENVHTICIRSLPSFLHIR